MPRSSRYNTTPEHEVMHTWSCAALTPLLVVATAQYLRTRKDTIRCIIHSLTEDYQSDVRGCTGVLC